MSKILLSACLLGQPVRYDGQSKTLLDSDLERLLAEDRIISFCPEVSGGLPVPRAAAEIQNGFGADVINYQAQVKTRDGIDVTEYFLLGAHQALELCRQHDITVAVLTESSPSCGSGQIYDGRFTRSKIQGEGVTTALLTENGIRVFNQYQFGKALTYLESLDG